MNHAPRERRSQALEESTICGRRSTGIETGSYWRASALLVIRLRIVQSEGRQCETVR